MKKLIALASACLLLAGCSAKSPDAPGSGSQSSSVSTSASGSRPWAMAMRLVSAQQTGRLDSLMSPLLLKQEEAKLIYIVWCFLIILIQQK